MPDPADLLANDTRMRLAAFDQVRRLTEVHDQLTAALLKPGFEFDGARNPLINPQRGIFKPKQMRFLLSIKTVVPRRGGRFWYDDQREAHRQIYRGEETVDYAFMGSNPDAADSRHGRHPPAEIRRRRTTNATRQRRCLAAPTTRSTSTRDRLYSRAITAGVSPASTVARISRSLSRLNLSRAPDYIFAGCKR